ncbi:MBL fold metallo-hydrolase [archaeon]|nr:MBL fold metallo-hydrolase [archaeon]
MPIEIVAIGGYGEVGKNMTAVKVDDEVVLFDMGLHLPNYITLTEEEAGEEFLSRKVMIQEKAAPDDNIIKEWRKNVKSIIISHAHLDHIGAIPYLAPQYNVPILCTNFTAEVIKTILKDQKKPISNEIKKIEFDVKYKISENLSVQFINVTHSTPDSSLVALHTPYGVVLYTNDFKLDNNPTLGKKTNYESLKKLGKIKLLILDSLYGNFQRKTPSECVAREMLRDILLGSDHSGKAIIVSTFSSHIARLKSIVEFGNKMNRKVIFIGRSLYKYCSAAEDAGIAYFSKEVELVRYGKQIQRRLRKLLKEGKEKYLLVVTGHQGEPRATLAKLVDGVLPFKFNPEDRVIFSAPVIPAGINQNHREILERKLKNFHVRIFRDVHVSGHGSREDMHEILDLLKPEHIIPSHSEEQVIDAFMELGERLGYKKDESLHKVLTGQRLIL